MYNAPLMHAAPKDRIGVAEEVVPFLAYNLLKENIPRIEPEPYLMLNLDGKIQPFVVFVVFRCRVGLGEHQRSCRI